MDNKSHLDKISSYMCLHAHAHAHVGIDRMGF